MAVGCYEARYLLTSRIAGSLALSLMFLAVGTGITLGADQFH